MIGLFLGDTDFSEVVLKKIKTKKIKYFIIDFSKKNRFKKDLISFFLLKKLNIRKIIDIFKYIDYINFFKKNNKLFIYKWFFFKKDLYF